MDLSGARVPIAAALSVAALAAIGWLDYRATSGDLRALRRSEADTLYDTIAAAARVQHAAAMAAEAALGQRLLDHARLLATFDRRKSLDDATVAAIASSTDVFRVVVFDARGGREFSAGEAPPGRGLGPGGATHAEERRALGFGGGPPPGASRVAERLLDGAETEVLSAPHLAREGGERIAAGVRRANGGAIVINAANRLASELESVYSLDALVAQIAVATPALGYIILEDNRARVAGGPLASQIAGAAPGAAPPAAETGAGLVPVLERRGTVALDETRTTTLRIGMRLDDVRRAETRAALRIGGGLGALTVAVVLGVAFGALRSRYGALSQRHALAQEALRRRDRLAAMGEMASTVAHEIRNPLNAIAMSAQRLAREYPPVSAPQEEASELVDVIQREASRIDGTVQQFLEFARPRPIDPREVDVRRLLGDAAAASAALGGARAVGVEVEPGPALIIHADPDQIRQALDNLVRNAIEATPHGGLVRLAAARRGRDAVIDVHDTGAGIPADVLPRIFDLYFTTKRDGTGVGLALVQQIVNAHGGRVTVRSQPGAGTRVTMELPRDGAPHG